MKLEGSTGFSVCLQQCKGLVKIRLVMPLAMLDLGRVALRFSCGAVQGICFMLLLIFSMLNRPVHLLSLRFQSSVGISSYKLQKFELCCCRKRFLSMGNNLNFWLTCQVAKQQYRTSHLIFQVRVCLVEDAYPRKWAISYEK